MSNLNNDYSYFLVFIIMILLITIFGNVKKYNSGIEYNTSNYQYLNSLTIFEKKLQKYNSTDFEFLKITDKKDFYNCLIPNIVDIFFINIKPFSFFNITSFISQQNLIMVLYIHNYLFNNLMLLVNKDNNYNYFYDITKKISILDIYPIYNNSNITINISVFILKKSFWYL